MKILIYSKPFWPSIGGVEVVTQLLANLTASHGHEVCVFTESALGENPELEEGYTIVRQKKLTFLALLKKCLEHDLIITNGGVSLELGICVCLLQKSHIIWHQMSGVYWGQNRNRLGKILSSWIVRQATFHVAVSRACLASKKLPATCPQCVIYNPCQPNFKFKKIKKIIDILFVGRFIEGKGLFILIAALKHLESLKYRLKVRLVGTGPLLPEIKNVGKSLKNISLRCCGPLRERRLSTIYAQSKILVVPSTTQPEGLPLVLTEGFRFGLPAIVSDTTIFREAVGNAGLYFTINNSKELAFKIAQLLRVPSLLKNKRIAALKRYERFSFENFSKKLIELFRVIHHD